MKEDRLSLSLARGALIAVVAWVALPQQARAFCNLDAQPVAHALGGYLWPCPDNRPVQAFIYLLGSGQSGTNSAGQDVACEDSSGLNGVGQQCQFEAGLPGDGRVTVLEDWGLANSQVPGCPNPGGFVGSGPIGVQVVCNDGKGILFTAGYADF